jgi:hypothetical protein
MIDLTQHINTCMQYKPVSELSGYVVMVWHTESYVVCFMQDSETLCAMKSKLQLRLNTQFDVNK